MAKRTIEAEDQFGPNNRQELVEGVVLPNLQLIPKYRTGRIHPAVQEEINDDALRQLDQVDPILRHILEIKVVCNPRRNFINLSIRKDYLTLIYQEKVKNNEVTFCFFLSDKLEPFVIITALEPKQGKLKQLRKNHLIELGAIIANFKNKYGIAKESYHYTPLHERNETDDHTRNGIIRSKNKSHSSHWHLKMRVATAMMKEKLPIFQLFDIETVKQKVEPVQYNYSRETKTWEQVYAEMEKDVVE
jgi:hypothetical protein